jgi:hypothetical protein
MKRQERKIVQVMEVLLMQGPVQSQFLPDPLQGRLVSPLSYHHPGRIAGKHMEQQKYYCDDTPGYQDAVPDLF